MLFVIFTIGCWGFILEFQKGKYFLNETIFIVVFENSSTVFCSYFLCCSPDARIFTSFQKNAVLLKGFFILYDATVVSVDVTLQYFTYGSRQKTAALLSNGNS